MSLPRLQSDELSDSRTGSSRVMQKVPSTSPDSSEYGNDCGRLVKAKAQVMVRDDSTGLWRPLLGGGMSVVELTAAATERSADDLGSPYRIQGRKLVNNDMVLSCSVTKELRYMSATPTFHHWQTNTERYGLAFQNTSEASEFKKVVCGTVDKICDELRRRDDAETNDNEFDTLTIEISEPIPESTEQGHSPTESTIVEKIPVCRYVAEPVKLDEIDLSPLQEVLPAVPPRRAASTSAASHRPPFDDLRWIVPRPSLVNHSSTTCLPQQMVTHPDARSMMPHAESRTTCDSKDDGATQQRQSSDSPPVPPRPDVIRSATWRQGQPIASRPPPKSHQSAAPVFVRCNHAPSSAIALPASNTNYVYFTEGNVVSLPSTAAVSKDSFKPKSAPWNELGENPNSRQSVRRLAEAFHSDGGAAGAVLPEDSCIGGNYVHLALPASGSPVTQAHDYCYPSLEVILPSGSGVAEQLQSSTSNRPTRNAASPPPLPTKSRLGWRDCRKKRRRAQLQQQQQRGLSQLVRLSYGTAEVVNPRRPVTTASTLVVGSSEVTLDDSLGHPARRRRRVSSSLLCLLPCSGRPCPQRRKANRPVGGGADSSSVERTHNGVA